MDGLLEDLNFYARNGWIESPNQWITMIREGGYTGEITPIVFRDYIVRRLNSFPLDVSHTLGTLSTIDDIAAHIKNYMDQFKFKKIAYPILLNVAKYTESYTLFYDEDTIIDTIVDAAFKFSDGDDVYPMFSISTKKRDGFLVLDACYELI